MVEALASLGPFELRYPGDANLGSAAGKMPLSLLGKACAWWRTRFGECGRWGPDFRDKAFRLQAQARSWARETERLPGMELAVIEEPVYFKALVNMLHAQGVPIIASCQNIETLSYPQIDSSRRFTLLRSELQALSLCELAISISREDTWLLRNFGIPAFYFPYYPPEQVRGPLLSIRKARHGNVKKGVILLGNAGNLATRKGMARVLEYWQENNLSQKFDRLQLAGYKTDCFFAGWSQDRHVEFLGPLAQDDFAERLSGVKACLVYQDGGGGALTRIAEMLAAGIPVLSSFHAARSYHGMPGVIEFRELQELPDALEQLERSGMDHKEIPIPPKPDAVALAAEINRILKDRKRRPGFPR